MKFYKGERVVFTGYHNGFTTNQIYIVVNIFHYDHYTEMLIVNDIGHICRFSVNPFPENETPEDKKKHVSYFSDVFIPLNKHRKQKLNKIIK